MDDKTTRKLFREGKAGQRMMAVVGQKVNSKAKCYRVPFESDNEIFEKAEVALASKKQKLSLEWGIEPVPDEPLGRVPITFGVINVWVYGMNTWGSLFNSRQKLALITFAEKVKAARRHMVKEGADLEVAKVVTTYLGIAMSSLTNYSSVLCRWVNNWEVTAATFSRQALPMVWDYMELNIVTGDQGWPFIQRWIEDVLFHVDQIPDAGNKASVVKHGSATHLPWSDESFDAVLTDPPYYDNVPYSYLSDFCYVWLKRVVGDVLPELFSTPLTPKSEEVVAYTNGGGAAEAKQRFEAMLAQSFREIHRVLRADGIAVIVFAYPKTEAWETAISGLLSAGMYMTSSWPIHTEKQTRLRAQESAALASSIYMICRKRTSREVAEFPKVRAEIESRVREKLDKFWNEGVRGPDFFMSAIGPAVEVFGRYERVEKLSGEVVEVKELLDYVEKVVSEFALERIGSTELGGVDPETRFYLLWRWTYIQARVPFDEGNKLAQAVGTELKTLWNTGGLVSKEKDFVRVVGPKDREKDTKFMNQVSFNTMVDALHRACIYWEHGQRTQLKEHLAQTFGANNIFWRVAQNIADVLPDGDKEKQLLQGLLNVPEARDKIAAGSGKLFAE
jgi:putative DNA methylase